MVEDGGHRQAYSRAPTHSPFSGTLGAFGCYAEGDLLEIFSGHPF